MTDLPMILLPGLNGDPRVFAPQAAAFPDVRPVRWTLPPRGDRLAVYAARLAGSLGRVGPCVVVGVSFGGIVATELARHVDATACVVIASARDPAGLPAAVRALRRAATVVPSAAVELAVRAGVTTAAPQDDRRRQDTTDRAFRSWAVNAMVTWRPAGPPPCPLVQIHGDRDRQFPGGTAVADHVIAGGGHLLTITHAEQVNAILADVVRRHAA